MELKANPRCSLAWSRRWTCHALKKPSNLNFYWNETTVFLFLLQCHVNFECREDDEFTKQALREGFWEIKSSYALAPAYVPRLWQGRFALWVWAWSFSQPRSVSNQLVLLWSYLCSTTWFQNSVFMCKQIGNSKSMRLGWWPKIILRCTSFSPQMQKTLLMATRNLILWYTMRNVTIRIIVRFRYHRKKNTFTCAEQMLVEKSQ